MPSKSHILNILRFRCFFFYTFILITILCLGLFQLHWIRTLKRYRESGHPSRAEKLEELLALIHGWRDKKGLLVVQN